MDIKVGMTIRVPAGASLLRRRAYRFEILTILGDVRNGVQFVRGRVFRLDGRPGRVNTRADFVYVDKVSEV